MPCPYVPVFASVIWIGGGSLGLLFAVVFLLPVLRRKPPGRSIEDATEDEDFTEPRD